MDCKNRLFSGGREYVYVATWGAGKKKREPGIVDKILEFHFVIKHLK